MKSQIETWSDVESKGIKWSVSTLGRVRVGPHSTQYVRMRNGKLQEFVSTFGARDITPWLERNGYLEVATMREGKRVKERLHRLVALAFCDGYEPGLTVNHIDGNKTNNTPSNLEWVSLAKNTEHQWRTGLVAGVGEDHHNAKLTTKQVVYIRRLLAAGISAHALSIVAGVSFATIAYIRDGKRWAHVAKT